MMTADQSIQGVTMTITILPCVVFGIAGPGVLLEAARIELNLLAGRLVLLCLEFEKLLAVQGTSFAGFSASGR